MGYGDKIIDTLNRIQEFDDKCAADEHTDTDYMWELMYEARDVLSDLAKYMIDCAMNPIIKIDPSISGEAKIMPL